MNDFFVLNLEPLTVQTLLIILVMVTLLGIFLAFSYRLTHLKQGYDKSILFTLLIMPLVVSVVVLLVSNNLARAFSLAGVFTLVRFRLAMRDASDLAYILAAVGIGLALALGYVLLGIIITLFLSIVLTISSFVLLHNQMPFGKLIIDISESDLDVETLENKMTSSTQFLKIHSIQSINLTQTRLVYRIKLKKEDSYSSFVQHLKNEKGIIEIKIQEGFKK